MQRRHSIRHLAWRGVVAAASNALMATGLYPLVPHLMRRRAGGAPVSTRSLVGEWGAALAVTALRPAGFLPLPGFRGHGPRPVVVLHGYAMNRANFIVLAARMAKAGLGPIYGFEYWTLGRTAAAARQLGWFVDQVRESTGAAQVDVVGHSMGGVVGRYYVTLGGGDGIVNRLITIGSPHAGTEVSKIGIGAPTKELVAGSTLLARVANAPAPAHTKMTAIWSRADAMVPGGAVAGAEMIEFPDLGHVALLTSRRVADVVIERLR